jgi:hypothetical protein
MSVKLGGEQTNLSTEGHARLGAKRGQQVGLRCPQAVIEAGEQFIALLGGNDSTGAPVGRIGATLNQVGCFEVIEEVGHDGTVDSEVVGQGELTTDGALSGGGEHLEAPGTAGKVGHGGVGRLDVGPKNHPQAPSEVVGERGLAGRVHSCPITGASDVIHHSILRVEPRRVVEKMLCPHDDLYRI